MVKIFSGFYTDGRKRLAQRNTTKHAFADAMKHRVWNFFLLWEHRVIISHEDLEYRLKLISVHQDRSSMKAKPRG